MNAILLCNVIIILIIIIIIIIIITTIIITIAIWTEKLTFHGHSESPRNCSTYFPVQISLAFHLDGRISRCFQICLYFIFQTILNCFLAFIRYFRMQNSGRNLWRWLTAGTSITQNIFWDFQNIFLDLTTILGLSHYFRICKKVFVVL